MLRYCNRILAGYIWFIKFTAASQITASTKLGTLTNITDLSTVKIFASAYTASKSTYIQLRKYTNDTFATIQVDNNNPLPSEVVNDSKGLMCSFACVATYGLGS